MKTLQTIITTLAVILLLNSTTAQSITNGIMLREEIHNEICKDGALSPVSCPRWHPFSFGSCV